MWEWINGEAYYDNKKLQIDNIKLKYESEHSIHNYGIEGYKEEKTHLNSSGTVHSVNRRNYKW